MIIFKSIFTSLLFVTSDIINIKSWKIIIFYIPISGYACILTKFKHGYVCVINSTHCENHYVKLPQNYNEFFVTSSTHGGLRFKTVQGSFNSNKSMKIPYSFANESLKSTTNKIDLSNIQIDFGFKPNPTHIFINEKEKFQKWQGFGGAFTGSSVYNLNVMEQNMRKCILKLFFSPSEGLGYTFIRWPIGSSDFDIEPWEYNETPENDINLTNFTKLHESDILKVCFYLNSKYFLVIIRLNIKINL